MGAEDLTLLGALLAAVGALFKIVLDYINDLKSQRDFSQGLATEALAISREAVAENKRLADGIERALKVAKPTRQKASH